MSETMMERSIRIAGTNLDLPDFDKYEVAADMHQFKKDHPFGEWSVAESNNSYVKRIRQSDGIIRAHPMTPVVCSCGHKRNVRTAYLKSGKSKSCGHTNSLYAKELNRESWRAREAQS